MNNITKTISDSNFKDGVTRLKAPYDVYKYDCRYMIPNADAFKLRNALLSMRFKKKSCDLYSFSQSPDLYRVENTRKPIEVQQFLEVLEEIKVKLSVFLSKEFNQTISVSCSKYDEGDYLLCHDDCVEDRSVAFIYYLNYDWLEEWGGTLDLYSVDSNQNAKQIELRINPEFNSMIFFPVGKNTYHQVAENISNFSRISINGWFHCDKEPWAMINQLDEVPSPIYLPLCVTNKYKSILTQCIDPIYEEQIYREAVKEIFEENGYIMCEAFLRSNIVEDLSDEIYSNNIQWETKGPLNKRHYKYLDLNNMPSRISFIFNLLRTDKIFSFFTDCTGLEFDGVNIEVQRWHGGHYMVSGGNDGLDHSSVLSVYFFFSQSCGEMSDTIIDDLHYVIEEQSSLTPKFACKPQDNTIFMVKRDPSLELYIKYCKKVKGHGWTVIVAHYFIKNNCKVAIFSDI